jgi:capsular polysaccharide transport system ATP-binding protein
LIILHSVTKDIGKGTLRRRVLDEVSWEIPARSQFVILAQKGSGKTTLINIMNGSQFPTAGWVERRGSISPGHGLLRGQTSRLTPRQMAVRLARLYRMVADEVVEFVLRFASLEGAMDTPVAALPNQLRRYLGFALIYAIPFDFYLFDNDIGPVKGEFAARCRQAFDVRCKDAGVILLTSTLRAARQFQGAGGILHEGKLTLYETAAAAIAKFEQLPPPRLGLSLQELASADEDEDEWL